MRVSVNSIYVSEDLLLLIRIRTHKIVSHCRCELFRLGGRAWQSRLVMPGLLRRFAPRNDILLSGLDEHLAMLIEKTGTEN